LLAVGGQGDPVRAGAQQRGADGVFELEGLAVRSGALDADLEGGVKEAGLADAEILLAGSCWHGFTRRRRPGNLLAD
jgi:hypothetical protein